MALEFGRIVCADMDWQDPFIAPMQRVVVNDTAHRYVDVHIPVSLKREHKGARDLQVVVRLMAPAGQEPPVARAATPTADFGSVTTTWDGGIEVKPKVGGVTGGWKQERTRQRLIRDLSGVGTSELMWTLRSAWREVPGSTDLRVIAQVPRSSFGWIEAKASLRRPSWLPWEAPEAAEGTAPLLTMGDGQADVTLRLEEVNAQGTQTLLIGRPQVVALTQSGGHIRLGRPGRRPADATGVLIWSAGPNSDNPAYTWTQQSSETVRKSGSGDSLSLGVTVPLQEGDELRFDGPVALQIHLEDRTPTLGGTLQHPLEVDVLVDGEVVSQRPCREDLVTIGREDRDICIERQEISRIHGRFELDSDGWWYRHESGSWPTAQVVRSGEPIGVVERLQRRALLSGDVVRLTDHVSVRVNIS